VKFCHERFTVQNFIIRGPQYDIVYNDILFQCFFDAYLTLIYNYEKYTNTKNYRGEINPAPVIYLYINVTCKGVARSKGVARNAPTDKNLRHACFELYQPHVARYWAGDRTLAWNLNSECPQPSLSQ